MGIVKDEKVLPTKIYTHADLGNFPDDEIWELIEGVPYQMAPPTPKHQEISTELTRQFANYLLEKRSPCKVYAAPFGIYLPNTRGKNNFVSPDLTIVCEKIEADKYYGVPPLVVEIISESNKPRKMHKKLMLYQELGIREYWMIYPDSKTVTIYQLNEKYHYEIASSHIFPFPGEPEELDEADPKVKVGLFDDLAIDFSLVFQ